MNFTHFIFAFYVFILVCGAIWFYGRVTGPDKKKDKSSYEKEHRLFVMYQNVEDMLDSFEEYAEGAKAGIDERLGQVEALIEGLRKEWENLAEQRARLERPAPVQEEPAGPVEIDRQDDPKPQAEPEAESVPEPAIKAQTPPVKQKTKDKNNADKPKPKTPDLIQQYAEQGMSKEEIAKALGISMREVTLIMEIKKIHV